MVSGGAEIQSFGDIRLRLHRSQSSQSAAASVVAFSDFATRAAFYGFITIIV
jgi:hypothetical protein